MTTLIGVEIHRMLARRAVRFAGLIAVLTVLAMGTLMTVLSDPNVSAARERRRVERAEEIRACLAGEIMMVPEAKGVDSVMACNVEYTPEAAAADLETRTRLDSLDDIYTGLAGPLAIVGLMLGATFLGAEWSSRSMAGILMWEPRRTRLLTAKAAACLTVVAEGCLAFLVMVGGASVFAAAMRGTTAGTNGFWLRNLVGLGLRVMLLTALASLIGVALTAVARSAAVSIGAAFVVLAPVEGAVRGLRPGWRPWLIGDNAGVFLTGATGAGLPGRSPLGSGILIGFYVLVLFAAAAAIFRRRDVA